MTQPGANLGEIRACVAAVRSDLRNPAPEILLARLPALAAAIERLSAPFEAGDLADLKALAVELEACRKLAQQGAAVSQVLAGILAGANAGYSSSGAPPPLAARGKLCFEA
ncbi:MAG TPA: hypothetical protein VKV74_06110 [Bryobacteraceae bacterium]|nr:hypothetical protein [Bryobacteraceae bacterium]